MVYSEDVYKKMGPSSVAPDEIQRTENLYFKQNKWDFLIIGADGQQGQITSRYLYLKGYKIVCVDLYTENLHELFKGKNVPIISCDCAKKEELLKILTIFNPKVVINLSYQESTPLAKICLQQKINFLDIFANLHWVDILYNDNVSEDGKIIQELCNKNKCVVITGAGCAPGISSMLAKKLDEFFTVVESVEAGFAWDSNIKKYVPPFCVSDAAEELFYFNGVVKDGEIRNVYPMSIWKEYDFPLIGKQKIYAINHVELYSFFNFFKKKGIQNITFFGGFPEHCLVVLKALNDLNLIGDKHEKMTLIGADDACDFTKQEIVNAISKQIGLPKNYTEAEIVWCTIQGKNLNDKPCTKTMLCKVPPIKNWEKYGCNVDTGVPAAIISEMIFKDMFNPGAYSPEVVVPCDYFFNELKEFGFEFSFTENI